MKTLAQLKKDIQPHTLIELTHITESNSNDPHTLYDIPLKERLQGIRKVSKVDTTGFYLKHQGDYSNLKGSKCDYPKASNLQYIDDTFTIIELWQDGTIWQIRTYKIIK